MCKKKIPGYEGLYYITPTGRIFKRDKSELKPHFSGVERRNYKQVTLYKGGVKKTLRVHTLMGITYLGHKGDRFNVIDHIDNDPLNNRLKNLQVLDNKTNCIKDRRNPKKPWNYGVTLEELGQKTSDCPF